MDMFGITDVGKVRKENQDSYILKKVADDSVVVAVVCDGMGGANAGALASKIASESFFEDIESGIITQDDENTLADIMSEAAMAANNKVYERSVSDHSCSGMGTTLVSAVSSDDETIIINIGDSRAYHIEDNKIHMVTRDHSLVADLVERGELTPEEAQNHPKKNLITRALGVDSEVLSDVFAVKLEKGDFLLLCTDGLSNQITDSELLSAVKLHGDVEKICKDLLELALERGAPDNVTIVALKK